MNECMYMMYIANDDVMMVTLLPIVTSVTSACAPCRNIFFMHAHTKYTLYFYYTSLPYVADDLCMTSNLIVQSVRGD
jgi:hypothetical protein